MNRSRIFSRLALLAFAAGMTAAAPSHAYRMIQNFDTGFLTAGFEVACHSPGRFLHWNNRNILWSHNTANQGWDKAGALQAAMASWTNVSGSDFVLTYNGITGAGFGADGVNTILWAAGNGCTDDCLALTGLVVQQGQVIIESDITFNNDRTWTTSGADFDTQSVAAHELGHSVGIHHTERTALPFSTMRATYFDSGGRSLEVDDIFGIQCAANQQQFNGCTWSAGIRESAGTSFVCPGNQVMAGRQHFGDENGTTQYLCCDARVTARVNCAWSAGIKESNGTAFSCVGDQVMVGRQHTGDENGTTRYLCCDIERNGVHILRDHGSCAWSPGFMESSSNFECPSVMSGRKHTGDENGTTQYLCCNHWW